MYKFLNSYFFKLGEKFAEKQKLRSLFSVGKDNISQSINNLATAVEGNLKASFSIATTPRWRERRYSVPLIALLYPWYVPYIAEC